MPKKDAATAVLGMLHNVGAQTRPAPTDETTDPGVSVPPPRSNTRRATGSCGATRGGNRGRHQANRDGQHTAERAAGDAGGCSAYLRLRPATAQALRDAGWKPSVTTCC